VGPESCRGAVGAWGSLSQGRGRAPVDARGAFGAALARSPPGEPVLKSTEEGEFCTRTTGVASQLFPSRFWLRVPRRPEDCVRLRETLLLTVALNWELLRPSLCVKSRQSRAQPCSRREMRCTGGISRGEWGCHGLEGGNSAASAPAPVPSLAANLDGRGRNPPALCSKLLQTLTERPGKQRPVLLGAVGLLGRAETGIFGFFPQRCESWSCLLCVPCGVALGWLQLR